MDRPELNNQLDSKTFREYYYLKLEMNNKILYLKGEII